MIDDTKIKLAINQYKRDILDFPIFFDPTKIKLLENELLISQVKNKFNRDYKPSIGDYFEIPYNRIFTRHSISLQIEDIIIKYIIKNEIENSLKFKVDQSDNLIESSIPESILDNQLKFITVVDILNFYDSINHKILIDIIKANSNISSDETLIILESLLKPSYILNDQIILKESGLLVGSKPDDFFAEIILTFMKYHLKKILNRELLRSSDEFIVATKDIKGARETVNQIEFTFSKFGLRINKSKTKIFETRNSDLNNKLKLKLFDESILEGKSNPEWSFKNGFLMTEISVSPKDGSDVQNLNISNSNITTYEESISFLKSMYINQNKVLEYQKKYPKYSLFYNIPFSKPTDFLTDYGNLNFKFLEIENLKTIKKIIIEFPKSEYYSAIAINLLVFVAKDLFFNLNYSILRDLRDKLYADSDYSISEIDIRISEACEFANIALIELLESEIIFDHQKYLILRGLFMSKSNVEISKNNFTIKQISYSDNILMDLNPQYLMEGFAPQLPFRDKLISLTKELINKTNHFPLIVICKRLTMEQ